MKAEEVKISFVFQELSVYSLGVFPAYKGNQEVRHEIKLCLYYYRSRAPKGSAERGKEEHGSQQSK